MLNRRLIRIKVFKVLYSSISSENDSISSSEKELLHSCDKTRDLYFFMLNIAVALKKASDLKIEAGLQKYHPTPEEKNPNMKFSDNLFVKNLIDDDKFLKYCEKNGLMWRDDLAIFVKKLFASISEKEYFIEYMSSPKRSLDEDCRLFSTIFEEEFEDNEELAQIIEDMNLYWIDDLAYVLNVIIRNIDMLREKGVMVSPSTFMKDDDKEFAIELLDFTMANYGRYLKLVTDNVSNWETDRLVATDISLIILGIAEAVHFPSIPIKVTINEYVEISKFYSTPNSKVFVNGLLDKLIRKLIQSGEVVKTGRGLIES